MYQYCKCNQYFKGDLCHIDLRACSHNPCINHGLCENIFDPIINHFDFKCKCNNLFYGKHCQHKVDICFNETCSNNGYCIEKNGTQECRCKYLFSGQKCQIKAEEIFFRDKVKNTSYVLSIVVIAFYYVFMLFLDIFFNSKIKK